MDSHFDKYRQELNSLNLTSMEDLEKLVKPLIRTITKIKINKSTRPPENSQLLSNFGGQAFFEAGEEWPKTKEGRPLDFVFQ